VSFTARLPESQDILIFTFSIGNQFPCLFLVDLLQFWAFYVFLDLLQLSTGDSLQHVAIYGLVEKIVFDELIVSPCLERL
jgi:hypothetical protein